MKNLIKPSVLKPGDIVATVSLSWGGASVFPERYEQGKRQFETAFNVKIIEMEHALKSSEDLYNHPEWRLQDMMEAFKNPEVKAILCNIGGEETIRLLRLMNDSHFEIIKNNPKIFMGISDTTVNHLMCLKAGLGSFYSACTMFGYAENGGIPEYMIENTKKTLFGTTPIGILPESKEYIIDRVPWGQETIIRPRTKMTPWRYIQGQEIVQGRLIGGCFDSLMECINGTSIFPKPDDFKDTILFIENSEEQISPDRVGYWFRTLGAMGILKNIKGILFAIPGGEFFPEETVEKTTWLAQYKDFDNVIIKICKEYDRTDLPIVTNMNFGHTVPQLILPYGIMTEIDPLNKTVSILENTVI